MKDNRRMEFWYFDYADQVKGSGESKHVDQMAKHSKTLALNKKAHYVYHFMRKT